MIAVALGPGGRGNPPGLVVRLLKILHISAIMQNTIRARVLTRSRGTGEAIADL